MLSTVVFGEAEVGPPAPPAYMLMWLTGALHSLQRLQPPPARHSMMSATPGLQFSMTMWRVEGKGGEIPEL